MISQNLKSVVMILKKKRIDPETIFTMLMGKPIKLLHDKTYKNMDLLNEKANRYLEHNDVQDLIIRIMFEYPEKYKEWGRLRHKRK